MFKTVREATRTSTTKKKKSNAFDLMVVLPKKGGSSSKSAKDKTLDKGGITGSRTGIESKIIIRDILQRLADTGYSHVALTHTIYGRPRLSDDNVDTAIPTTFWKAGNFKKEGKNSPPKKKRKKGQKHQPRDDNDDNINHEDLENIDTTIQDLTFGSGTTNLRILRRLHVVIENLSDVGPYMTNNGPYKELLNGYDIISISPRNDAVFQSVCSSASMADIITLDYNTGRGFRLPYSIRKADVKEVINRNAAFEIPYAPAILNPKYRKALVRTGIDLKKSSWGLTDHPILLFSSGDRTVAESDGTPSTALDDDDAGEMALRMPDDIRNLMETIVQFSPKVARAAIFQSAGMKVLKRSDGRRYGKNNLINDVLDVTIKHHHTKDDNDNNNDDDSDDDDTDKESFKNRNKNKKNFVPVPESTINPEESDESNDQDGFISMS